MIIIFSLWIVVAVLGVVYLRRSIDQEMSSHDELDDLLKQTQAKIKALPTNTSLLPRPLTLDEVDKALVMVGAGGNRVKPYPLDYLLREGLVDVRLADGLNRGYQIRTNRSPNKVQVTPMPYSEEGDKMLLNEVTGEVLTIDGAFLEKYGVRHDKLA